MTPVEARNEVLRAALEKRVRVYDAAIERLRSAVELDADLFRASGALREAIELVRVLRRLVLGRSAFELHEAFGAPGDFGYETPIGAALNTVYRGGK